MVSLVLEVGVGERQFAGAVRLGQHALELDLGESPIQGRTRIACHT